MGKDRPFYQQIREDIKNKILQGHYKWGTYLPSEKSLEEEYHVSRTTIRSAVNDLVQDRYLYIVRGKGTKVVYSRLMDNNPNLLSFTEILRSHGYVSQILEHSCQVISADEFLAKKLVIDVGEEVVWIYRVRGADNEVISVNDSYLPKKILEGRPPEVLLNGDSMYENLKKHCHIMIEEVREEIWAVSADAHFMDILNVTEHAPLLAFERESFSKEGILTEYSKVVYRSDLYRHAVVMRRTEGQGD